VAKGKILLVEDNKGQADQTRQMLENSGYEVVWVDNGMSAIKFAKVEEVDLVLLDLVLPGIDGNEVCRWLKLNDDTKGIPIIMLTVRDSVRHRVEGLEAGADDYLPKPYNEVELNARIYASLRTKSLQDELRKKNTQLEEMLERVEILAITDPLTELFNRRRFELVLDNEFIRSQRYKSPLSCLMIDVDHFKAVNDELGHQGGDAVLKEIVAIIRNSIREVDTAARWGGEEFAVLLPETTTQGAVEPALRILNSIAGYAFNGLGSRPVTVSIGIAGLPSTIIDKPEKLLNWADSALFEAKNNGRNRIEIANPEKSP